MLHGPLAHQAVVGMVVDGFYSHCFHQPIKDQSGIAFEESVGLTFFAYAVNDVIACFIAAYHVRNHLNVILQVCINGNGYLAMVFYGIEPCQQGILMPYVSCQVQSAGIGGISVQFFDDGPCLVGASVIHI